MNTSMIVEDVEYVGFTGEEVYDLTIEDTHTYIVSESDIVVHNSGVGSDYSTATRRVDWDYMPDIRLVLDGGTEDDGDTEKGAHADFSAAINEFAGFFDSLRDAKHKYPSTSERVRWFKVKDTKEGWAEIIAILETAAFHKQSKDRLFIFDFSDVRCAGTPIMGQQGRPASGPVPLMRAVAKVASIKNAGMRPWKQAIFVDHYLACCVALGGVRRAARLGTKYWEDDDIFDFIEIKRGGFLWSANMSILVDKKFWEEAKDPRTHAARVFQAATAAQYLDKTGEPGFINIDLLCRNQTSLDELQFDDFFDKEACGMELHPRTFEMMENIFKIVKKLSYPFIVNPCAEQVLFLFGAYCVLGDNCLAKVDNLKDFYDSCYLQGQFLVRSNLMQPIYKGEVQRTNRIGVSLNGIFEFMWRNFNMTIKDAISVYDYVFNGAPKTPTIERYMKFWEAIQKGRDYAIDGATTAATRLGISIPHTFTCLKPGGTTPKIMNCTEAANPPAYGCYIRWVQYQKWITDEVENPELTDLRKRGYPTRDISHQYYNVEIVGFPTRLPISELMGDNLVIAGNLTPIEQFQWLRLMERFWLGENRHDGTSENSQISFTLKYDPDKVSYLEYVEMVKENMPLIRCCAIMPQIKESAYVYVPEEVITIEEYDQLMEAINRSQEEGYDDNLLTCEGGACPIEQDYYLS